MPDPTWIEQALADAENPDTHDDLKAILRIAVDLVTTDSIGQRNMAENLLRGRLARLRRIYDRA